MKTSRNFATLLTAACLCVASSSSAQFWARLLNPTVTVDMRHPSGFGLEVETLVFGPASGECSNEILGSLIGRFLAEGIRVVNREEADLILAEHQLTQEGWVNPESAAAVGELLGPSALVTVNVSRCAVEQEPTYRDRVRTRKDPDTGEEREVREREFFSTTKARLSVFVQVVDMATGQIVGVIRSNHDPQRVNRSEEGQPEFPPAYEVLDTAYAAVHEEAARRLLGWTETRELVFYDDDDCGLKRAHRALESGMLEQALELSLENLERCSSASGIQANKLARAYYNVGMSHTVLGEYEAGLGYLRHSARFDDGGIVRDAIQSAESAIRLQEEMRRYEAGIESELARRDAARKEQLKAAAAGLVTNADVVELVAQGLSEAIVIKKIQTSECRFDTSRDGLVGLTNARVPEPVILAMMDARCGD